jgi:hypothetical protein
MLGVCWVYVKVYVGVYYGVCQVYVRCMSGVCYGVCWVYVTVYVTDATATERGERSINPVSVVPLPSKEGTI